eukprot:4975025-Pleurochrysis_carterae.AAC.1
MYWTIAGRRAQAQLPHRSSMRHHASARRGSTGAACAGAQPLKLRVHRVGVHTEYSPNKVRRRGSSSLRECTMRVHARGRHRAARASAAAAR